MIIVTGATGALNGATVDHLLTRVPADRIGVSVRDPAKARHLAERGVRVRQGSYEDPAALRHSFEGAEQVLLVSTNDPHVDAAALHRVGVEAAVAAGAGRILYTSHQAAAPDSLFAAAPGHAATERLLAESGVAWTALRNGFYAHSLGWLLGPWQRTGTIAVPADGPVSWTDRADLAEAAAAVLAGDGVGDRGGDRAGGRGGDRVHDGPVTLTAREAVTFADIAAVASRVTGRPVRRVVVADEEWVADKVRTGTPEPMARMLLGFFHAARAHCFAGTGPALAELLGREPRGVADQLASSAEA